MKLVSISFCNTPRMPGLRPTDLGTIQIDKPGDALKDWHLVIRGSQAFFISPPGWTADHSSRRVPKDKSGLCVVHGPIALSEMYLEWRATPEELDTFYKNVGKYESEPFGYVPPLPVDADKPILDQVPPGQMGDA